MVCCIVIIQFFLMPHSIHYCSEIPYVFLLRNPVYFVYCYGISYIILLRDFRTLFYCGFPCIFLMWNYIRRQLKKQVDNLKALTDQLQVLEKDKFATEQEINKLKRQVSIWRNNHIHKNKEHLIAILWFELSVCFC